MWHLMALQPFAVIKLNFPDSTDHFAIIMYGGLVSGSGHSGQKHQFIPILMSLAFIF